MEGSRLIADDCCAEGTSVEGVMGLLDDNDFAYAYTDYDQVVGLAGHHVADHWLQTRGRVEEELLAAGAEVVEDNPTAPRPQDDLQEETPSNQRGQGPQRGCAEEG